MPDSWYDRVYGRDNPPGDAHGWIQWKETRVCIDLTCACGHGGHYDGDFLYFYECSSCGARYAVGQNVKLIPLSADEAVYGEGGSGFKKCEDEDDHAR